MAITKETLIGQMEIIGEFKSVQVRTDTVVKEDGLELSRSYHRHVLHPDADITSETTEVQGVCNAVWTDQIKADYATFKANQENN
tara:strand:+ start:697 stop:951 length:255 start_codon:yes stop_codon:yes gene_type:complete